MKMKRIMGFFLALVICIGYLPLNPMVSYANDNVSGGVANGDVKIDDENNFPDEWFRSEVGCFDTDRNGYLSKKELEDVRKIDVSVNAISSLKGIEYFKNLEELNCAANHLTSLDLSKNMKLRKLRCCCQRYDITVDKVTRKFKYSEFPGHFDRKKVTLYDGANFGADALTVNRDATEVTYKYKVSDTDKMDVKLNVTYFDPENVAKMVVTKQPTKRIYTDGEKLDLTGLKVKLTDNQGLTEDVEFKDFETYHIKANPKNDTPLTVANNNKPVTLTTGKGKAQTDPLTVNPKVVGPVDPTQPGGGKPADISKYWTVTFKSADTTKGTVAAKNTVYVLKSATKTLADIQAPEKTAKTGYEFDKWEPALDAHTTIDKNMTVSAYFKAPTPQNPPDPKPQPKTPAPTPEPKSQPETSAPKLQPETSASKPQPETSASKLQPMTPAPKSQPEKRIGVIPKTGESASFAGLLAALGFSITGLAIFRKKKMMKENNK